ncbi:MAG TPA: MFS transporter [Chloroflexota bacterium]|nr:MFS transporter [Chloroflexota bacterium]
MPGLPADRIQATVACILGNVLLRLGNSATGVLLGLVLASMNRSGSSVRPITIGILAISFYATELLGAPVFGVFSDRYGRRIFMIAGPVFGAVAIQFIGWPTALVAWPVVLAPMVLGRMLEGFSTATSAPATLSFLTRETAESPAVRGQVMAWYEVATVVGIGGGFVAGGLLWDHIRLGAFVAITGVYLASLFCFWQVRDRGSRRPAGAQGLGQQAGAPEGEASLAPLISVMRLARRPRVLRFVPAWLAVNTIIGVWFTHSTFQLTGGQRSGQALAGAFSGTSLGGAFILFGVAFIVGVVLWGRALGTMRKTTVMLATVVGIFLICGALLGINHINARDHSWLGWFVAVFLIGVAVVSGFTPAALAYLADISEETVRQRGAVMGLYSVILGLGQMAGGALGSPFAAAAGVDGLIMVTAILGAVAFAAVFALRRFEEAQARSHVRLSIEAPSASAPPVSLQSAPLDGLASPRNSDGDRGSPPPAGARDTLADSNI